MATNNNCDWWTDLLFDTRSRGQIYDHFDKNREELVKHLQGCNNCKNVLTRVEPMTTIKKASKNPQDFARLIRKIYADAPGKLLKDDSVNADHD